MIDALAFIPPPPPPPPLPQDVVNSFDELFVVTRNQYNRDGDEFRACLHWSFL